jgi:HK97 family phage major capsid protein
MSGTQPGGRSDPVITGGEDSMEWAGLGEFMFKVRQAALSPFADPRLAPLSAEGQSQVGPQAITPLRKDVDSEGGFLIPDEYRQTLIQRMYTEGELLSRIKAAGMAFSLSGNTLKIPYVDETARTAGNRWGGVRGYWVEEGGSLTESEPKFGQLNLSLHKAGCLGYITEEMLEDHAASGQFLENAFVSELNFTVEQAIVRGDGSGKPRGLINADCAVSITKETNQTADTVWGPNIIKMWARMWAGSRRNAVWLINQDVETFLWGLTLEGRWGSASTDV